MTVRQDAQAVDAEARGDAVGRARLHPARIAGRVALGLVLGLTLLPALLELAVLSGAASAFKYQGF